MACKNIWCSVSPSKGENFFYYVAYIDYLPVQRQIVHSCNYSCSRLLNVMENFTSFVDLSLDFDCIEF